MHVMPTATNQLPLTETITPSIQADVAAAVRSAFDTNQPLYLLGGQTALDFGHQRRVAQAAAGSKKPVLVTRVGAEFLAPASVAFYQEAKLPLFPMPDRAVSALRAMVDAGVASAQE